MGIGLIRDKRRRDPRMVSNKGLDDLATSFRVVGHEYCASLTSQLKRVVTRPSVGRIGKLCTEGSLARRARAHQVIFLLDISLSGVRRFDHADRKRRPSRKGNPKLTGLSCEIEECRARNEGIHAEEIRADRCVFLSRQGVHRSHSVRFVGNMADELRAPHRSIDANAYDEAIALPTAKAARLVASRVSSTPPSANITRMPATVL